jgi:exodeoxyribonuclease-3
MQKLISWNLNGIRASVRKGLLDSIAQLGPDAICFQETKAQDDQVLEALADLTGYHIYSNSAVKKGYAGTAILSKEKPISTSIDIGIEAHDQEGRVTTVEFKDYYLSTVYVPNSKRDLVRLDYRKGWDADFLVYLKDLETKKPVVVCGDFNVANNDIDLARPKPNYNKTAGYTQTEIDGMNNFLGAGFIDSFRHLYPTREGAYSWWSYRAGAKQNNVGWRIDYFLVSESLTANIQEATIHPDYNESDHCPVGLELNI